MADPGFFNRDSEYLKGFDLIKLLDLFVVFGQKDLSKQCRSKSDATKRDV